MCNCYHDMRDNVTTLMMSNSRQASNSRLKSSIALVLLQRRRWWPNIEPTMGRRLLAWFCKFLSLRTLSLTGNLDNNDFWETYHQCVSLVCRFVSEIIIMMRYIFLRSNEIMCLCQSLDNMLKCHESEYSVLSLNCTFILFLFLYCFIRV